MPKRYNGRAPTKRLTKDELAQLVARRDIISRVQLELAMLQESNQQWAVGIQVKYELRPQFEIDVRTGQLTEKLRE